MDSMEKATAAGGTRNPKIQYVLWMLGAFGLYALSLLDPAISGPKLWTIFGCMGLATSVAALKLRRLIHGAGWVFPRTNTILIWVVPIETLLYLWFSH
jgi:hypothetical protein